LAIFVSCTKTTEDKAFIKSNMFGSVYDNVIITWVVSNKIISYTDIESGVSVPSCVQPNCTHSKKNAYCTAQIDDYAFGLINYDNSLYILGREFIYKCDSSGSNRRIIYEIPLKTDAEYEYSSYPDTSVLYKDSKIYFVMINNISKEVEWEYAPEHFQTVTDSTNTNSYTIHSYDFKENKGEVIYETEFYTFSHLNLMEITENNIFFNLSYNANTEWDLMTSDEVFKSGIDIFNLNNESVSCRLNIKTGEFIEFDKHLNAVSGNYMYFIENGEIVQFDWENSKSEVVYAAERAQVFDDTLFAYGEWDETYQRCDIYFLKDKQWQKAGFDFLINFETRDYFVSMDNNSNLYAILKSDYYAGIDTSFKIG